MEKNRIKTYSHFLDRMIEIRILISNKVFYAHECSAFIQDDDWETCENGDGFINRGEKYLFYNIGNNLGDYLYSIRIPIKFVDDDKKIEEIIQENINKYNKENGYKDKD